MWKLRLLCVRGRGRIIRGIKKHGQQYHGFLQRRRGAVRGGKAVERNDDTWMTDPTSVRGFHLLKIIFNI